MDKDLLKEIAYYVEKHIQTFHDRRIEKLKSLRLKDVLKRKNPYLFKAKDLTPEQLIDSLLGAFLSSQEETIFGDFLENLAIFVCERTLNGRKSAVQGVDLEFTKGDTLYLVSIKSGPNWGNSSQIKKMIDDFKKAARTHRSNNPESKIIAVNGCCYGVDENPDKGDYFKYCGQKFWEFITNDSSFYLQIIEPLGVKAKEKNQQFFDSYNEIKNKFLEEFKQNFCQGDQIDWSKLVEYNSKAQGLKTQVRTKRPKS